MTVDTRLAPVEQMNLAQMSVAELRSESLARYQAAKSIEDKYEHGLTEAVNGEDYRQVKTWLGDLDTIENALGPKEEAEDRKNRINGNVEKYMTPARGVGHRPAQVSDVLDTPRIESPGDQFVNSPAFKVLIESGVLQSNRNTLPPFVIPMQKMNFLQMAREQKALVYSGSSVGGGLVRNDVRPGILDILQRDIIVTDLVPQTTTESDTIEYVREDTFTNNAAFVAEATATTGTTGLKPESALAYSVQTTPVKTLAHWIPVTNRMLSDAPALRGIINQRLLLGLDLALETQIISGNGSGENLTGILNTAGINIESAGSSDNTADALYKGRTQVMVTGLGRPSAYVLHPNDWQAIRLLRENVATGTLGGYLLGPPTAVTPVTLWGLPVIESLGITENTALVGDWAMGAMLFDRERSQLRVGTIDDQFVRNMQTILAELRMAMAVFRPSAFTKITGV